MRKSDRYSQRAAARLELLPGPDYGEDFNAEDGFEGSYPDAEGSTSASPEYYRPQHLPSSNPDRVAAPERPRRMRDDFDSAARIPTQDDSEESQFLRTSRPVAVRRGRLPQTIGGKIAIAFGSLVALSAIAALAVGIGHYLLHDDHFRLATPEAIHLAGEQHVSHTQLMEIFSHDVGHNVFTIPLSDRRAALESIPWVEHATVMRLLPNRLRVTIAERKPVAFTRDGSSIGLVDANGVLMPMPQDAEPAAMSLPVVIGMTPDLPLSTRAARMAIYNRFVAEIDSAGPPLSRKLSEVDLTDPEDVKALIPEDGMDVLVHFGNASYLARFQSFEQHLPEWREMYPHLASADMRYDHQVVLDMQTGASPEAAAITPPAVPQSVPPTPAPAVAPQKAEAQKPAPQNVAAQKPVAQTPVAKTQAPPVKNPPAPAQVSPAPTAPVQTVAQNKPGKHSAAIPLAANAKPAPLAPPPVAARPAPAKANPPAIARTNPPTRGTAAASTNQRNAAANSAAKTSAPKPNSARTPAARTVASKTAAKKPAPKPAAKHTPAAKTAHAPSKPQSHAPAKTKHNDDAPMVLPSITSGNKPHKFVPAPVTSGFSGGAE